MSCMYKSILLLIGALTWNPIAFADDSRNKTVIENHPKYEALKIRADNGDWGGCYSLARLYEKYDQNAEAFEYWECALRKIKPGRPASVARHLAGHYFYGIGVETDVEKAAMYYILSARGKNRLGRWAHIEENSNLFAHPYSELIDIPDIEEKFKVGAALAKKNVDLHEISDRSINSRLASILHRIETVEDGTWFHGFLIFWSTLFGFAIFVNVMRKLEAS